ncbi:Filament-like plant protein 7 [Gossypium arboreum]|uniref:Filament-like plant protein 7 n=2 Tax=Gossypium arboreum TaxID=29729 RepID=A0A0B0P3U8_GOSAR|nr:filament-like plant protein 7 isoform X1 [Gossypium arboreum]XP_017623459.1 filament-like plant protein 7 isoform X1 [Gossypium arboreum]KAK5843590.1 hypothetical protein PVK06_006047 [Gossypium arboreum]KHG18051.1 Filament-like plant protein 7 [Gossypium arboreum]
MDQKIWLWRKKSTEKIILGTDKLNISQKGNEEEIQILVADKKELENELKILNEKLASALCDCNYKDELVKERENMALQAIAGREKAESEATSLKGKLDEALQRRVTSEERVTHLDAALKECMRQLRFVREEQERRIRDAVMSVSKEFEKSGKGLEEKLAETSKRVNKLGVENTNLSKALLAKEKMIDDLNKQRALVETDLNALMARLQSMEKDNAALRYEVRVLEKEVEIRNEEREFNRRTAEATSKQRLENVKKIAKLESECQRLRLLVRKRLPGPAALAKMKDEAEMLGKDSVEMRRRKLNSSPTSPRLDPIVDYSDSPSKKINILTEQLHAMEGENKALMEALNSKTSELQLARAMYARAATKFSDVESQFEESSKSLPNDESTRNSSLLASMSDVGIDDKASSAESGASALISELEHLRNGQLRKSLSCQTVVSSEINLMDDFVEMEKLALVSVDKLSGSSHVSSDEGNGKLRPLQTELNGKEIVLVPDRQCDHSMLNNEMKPESRLLNKVPGRIEDITKVIFEQSRATQRNPDEILEDIRKALACMTSPNTAESFDKKEGSDRPGSSDPSCISSYVSWKPSNGSLKVDSCNDDADVNICSEENSNLQFHPDSCKSICKIIELIEGINLPSTDYNIPETMSENSRDSFLYKHSETPSGYVVRVFQWKTLELSAVLEQFVQACYDLLNGKTDLNKFTEELTSVLDWIINHCFSLQDVSSMRDAIKSHFDWESESDSEVGIVDKFHLTTPYNNEDKNFIQKKDPNTSSSLLNQLEESEKTIETLQAELQTSRKAEEMTERQVEKPKWRTNEIFDKPHTLTKYKRNECHEELVTTCLDSVTENEIPSSEVEQDGNQIRTNCEIRAASEKLAECQETILNLGKQLKALASPKKASLFDNVITTRTETVSPTTSTTIPTPTWTKSNSRRSSLLDQMISEDKAKGKGNTGSAFVSNGTTPIVPTENTLVLNQNKHQEDNKAAAKSLAIVPKQKQGGRLWKKLFQRKGFRC